MVVALIGPVACSWSSAVEKEPNAGDTKINPKDGAETVFIPGGRFRLGRDEAPVGERKGPRTVVEPSGLIDLHEPARWVSVKGFWMYAHEVTNEQYGKFIKATGHRTPKHWDDGNYNRPKQPVVGVSWHDAVSYCKWVGGRLPTEAEWEHAARGGKQHEYATLTGKIGRLLANIRLRDKRDDTSPVGSFRANPFGLHDMCGNVEEWCSSLSRPYPYRADDGREDPNVEAGRVTRGGVVFDGPRSARRAVRAGDWNHPDFRSDHVGFRLCASPSRASAP